VPIRASFGRLVRIIYDDELLGCLESDLDRYYSIDVRGLFTQPRKLTYRQVIVRIRHLPHDSALARRGEAGEYKFSFQDKLQAALLNELRLANYYYVVAHSDAKKKPPKEPQMLELD
jgi:hypothetical protein